MMRNTYLSIAIVFITLTSYSQTDNLLTSKEIKEGWALLFDGKSINGWSASGGEPVPEGTWTVTNGCLGTVISDKSGDIITLNEYSDFELCIDYKITPACNSGIKYLFTNYENGGNLGCEFQIIDDKSGEDIVQANHLCGSLYDLFPPQESKKKVNPPGEWNSVRIIVKGNEIEHWMNNVMILKCNRGDKTFTDAVAKSKFNKTVPPFGKVEKGHILLQYHGGLVSFKNIKIRELRSP